MDGTNLINGEQRGSAGTLEVLNPATGEAFATIPAGTASDVHDAVAAARAAQPAWAARPASDRAAIVSAGIARFAADPDALSVLAVNDTGHPIRLAAAYHVYGPAQWGPELAQAASALATRPLGDMPFPAGSSSVEYSPYGVVGVLTPFNAPSALSVWKAVPALVLGNAVVAKPSPLAPLLVDRFYAALHEAGVPAGVINLVHGDVEPSQALAAHPGIDKLTFTGSTAVGRQIMAAAAANLTPVVLELGGKSPAIILQDAEMELAARAVASSCFTLSGQICAATTRVFVHASQADDFTARLAELAEQLVVGDPLQMETDMGPLVTEAQGRRAEQLVATAAGEGAKVVTGGNRVDGVGGGWFMAPTVLSGVDNRSTMATTEVFGPVLAVITYEQEADAVAMANDSSYGLVGAVFGSDLEHANRVASQVQAGSVWVNDVNAIFTAAPFGGFRDSGIGRELGTEGILEFVQAKHKFAAADLDVATRAYALVGSRW
jgi:aldehyde dehydrogenase (NAD+)